MRCYGTERAKQGEVDNSSEEDKFSSYLMDEFLVFVVEGRSRQCLGGKLHFGAIHNWFWRERGVLRCGGALVLTSFQCFGDVSSHR